MAHCQARQIPESLAVKPGLVERTGLCRTPEKAGGLSRWGHRAHNLSFGASGYCNGL